MKVEYGPEFEKSLRKMAWFYRTRWINPKEWYRQTKWFIQRGKRGWADCDWWNLDSHVSRIMIAMLTEMRDKGVGYRGESVEAWHQELNHMINAFEVVVDYYGDDHHMAITSDEQAVYDRGMDVFKKVFWGLWD